MSEKTDDTVHKIDKDGEVDRSTDSVATIAKPGDLYVFDRGTDTHSLTIGGRPLRNVRTAMVEMVYADLPPGQHGSMLIFKVPDTSPTMQRMVVGVKVAPLGSKPEVDGVWVADEGDG